MTPIDVGPWAEIVWIVSALIGFALTFKAEREAYKDVLAVRELNGSVVGIAVRGTLAQERYRLAIQILFIGAGLWQLSTPGYTAISPATLVILLVPIYIDLKTIRGLQDRRAITAKGLAVAVGERDRRMDRLEEQGVRIEAAVAENTAISQGARDDAHVAAEAANAVNEKIADQSAQIVAQGERQDRRDASQAKLQVVADDTAEQVHDIHDVTVPGDAS